jgi:proline dehydrogenase
VALDVLRPRVSHTTCARCRKLFKAGERAIPAYIIMNPNTRDPQTQELSIQMSGEFEFVHASCVDPMLDGRLVVTT